MEPPQQEQNALSSQDLINQILSSPDPTQTSQNQHLPHRQQQEPLSQAVQSSAPASNESSNSKGKAAQPGTPARSDALLLAQAVKDAIAQERGQVSEEQAADALSPTREDSIHGEVGIALKDSAAHPTPLADPKPLDAAVGEEEEEFLSPDILFPDEPRSRMVDERGETFLDPRFNQPMVVWAWGCAHNYQLGTGQYLAQSTPTLVHPLTRSPAGIVDISCGGDHCGAVDQYGMLYMWGLSDHGRLGLAGSKDTPLPTKVKSLSNERIVSVSCGMYSSACISETMNVFTWGAGGAGQLGHGERSDEWVPRMVVFLQDIQIVQVALGFQHTVAVSAAGTVYSWGAGEQGQLGHGNCDSYSLPRQVNFGLSEPQGQNAEEQPAKQGLAKHGTAVMVACGAAVTLVLTTRGRMWSFGSSEHGALGIGKVEKSAAPHLLSSRILDKRIFVNIAVGDDHCAAVTSKGNVYTWGQGCFGAVGKPPQHKLLQPPDCLKPYRLTLPEGSRASQVSCGGNYTAILLRDGRVLVLGDDDTTLRPVTVCKNAPDLESKGVCCGRFHTVAVVEMENAKLTCGGEFLTGNWLLDSLALSWRFLSSLWSTQTQEDAEHGKYSKVETSADPEAS